ncbi:MAG: hypothetical protein JKY95_10000 [Planctomycetaceae bacterium]|nr:hypothetical protein [Planctomycetaceae bacterium]
MKSIWFATSGISIFTLCMTVALCEELPKANSNTSAAVHSDDEDSPLSVDDARNRAKLLHKIYTITLDVMHDRYFHGDRAIVPARAMEDVFAEIQLKENIESRWISVNMKAMSVNHKPETEFEKLAAKEIAKGKREVETIAGGFYRRVGAIPLGANCTGCHGGLFSAQSNTPKFAGLVISIPIQEDTTPLTKKKSDRRP